MKFKKLNEYEDVRNVGWYFVTPGEPAPDRVVDNIREKYFPNFKISWIKRVDSTSSINRNIQYVSIAIKFTGGELLTTLCDRTCDKRFHDFQVRWITSTSTWQAFNNDMKELNEIVNIFKKKSVSIFNDCFEGL